MGVVAEREYATAGVDELLEAEKGRAAVGLGEGSGCTVIIYGYEVGDDIHQ